MALREPLTSRTHSKGTGVSLRRNLAAWCMPVAIALIMLSNSVFALLNPDGLSEEIGAEAVELYERGPDLWTASIVSGTLGVLLLIPGTLAVMRAVRLERPWLSLVSGSLMIAGYVCYFGVLFGNFDFFAWMAFDPQRTAQFVDQAGTSAVTLPYFLLFILGNLLGTLLLGLSVVLSRGMPRWAGFLIMGWPVGHVINLTVGNEWYAVAGGALEMIGMIAVALRIGKFSNREWLERG